MKIDSRFLTALPVHGRLLIAVLLILWPLALLTPTLRFPYFVVCAIAVAVGAREAWRGAPPGTG